MYRIMMILAAGLCGGLVVAEPVANGRNLSHVAAALDTLEELVIEGDGRIVAEGPNGEKVLRTDDKLEGAIDLKALGIEPTSYDLIKIEVKADSRAWLIISLENYPRPGWTSRWYPLDAVRAGFAWRTIWLDLKRPEEMFKAGGFGGTEKEDTESRHLRFSARVQPAKRLIQDPGRAVLLRNLRFVRKAVHLDWDQTTFDYTWQAGEDLVFDYPLSVTNRLDETVTAAIALYPFKVEAATASVTPESVTLAPGETVIVKASVKLPAAVAAGKPPLYSEFFEARASVDGIPDSDVTILRSADPIHLGVTVPVPDDQVSLPLLPRRRNLPTEILKFNDVTRKQAETLAEAVSPDDLDAWLGDIAPDRFQQPWRPGTVGGEASKRFLHGLAACAWLYDFTGDKKHLDKGTALLLHAADRFSALREQWAAEDVALISDGILFTYCLGLGWEVGGHWAPYEFTILAYGHSDGLVHNFDLLAADMDPAARETIVRNLILPAALQMRNHYVGLTNIQNVQNYPVLYAGLLTRNWPLAAQAYASEHGILNLLEWQFDEDGLANEGHYHTACIRPILWTTELLWHAAGIDLYGPRLHTILHSKSAEAIGQSFNAPGLLAYLAEKRFEGKPFLDDLAARPQTDGYHLTGGVTQLKWQGLALSMNWGTHIFRGARDRCAPRFEVGPQHPLAAMNGLGGTTYSYSCFDQSVIVVDEGLQNPAEADVTGVDVTGPIQFVQARSDQHFPGTTITRTFALIGRNALIVDRVSSNDGKPHTVDWIFRNRAVELSIPLEERQGSWTTKQDIPTKAQAFGAGITSHQYAKTDATFTNSASLMTMLGGPETELHVYPVHHNMKALMVRRRNVHTTDYLAFFAPDTQSIERVPVSTADGRQAEAVGIKITLKHGKIFHVIVNYEPENNDVSLGGLTTSKRFASDYEE